LFPGSFQVSQRCIATARADSPVVAMCLTAMLLKPRGASVR
jgi:hypothetical protein